MTDKSKQFWIENIFRPVFELHMCIIWALAAIATLVMGWSVRLNEGIPLPVILAVLLAFKSAERFKCALPLLRRQFYLSVNYLWFVDRKKFRADNQKQGTQVLLGRGFVWGAEHAQRVQAVIQMPTTRENIQIPWILRGLQRRHAAATRHLGGEPWIHGLDDEREIRVKEEHFHAHTCIFGVPGSGKTTLLNHLSISALQRNNVVIIIDPKNDSSWRESLRRECEELGLADQFHYFHPGRPSTSIAFDPLSSYNRRTELVSRLTAVFPGGEDGSNPFVNIAWGHINSVIGGYIYLAERPQIKNIYKGLTIGRSKLATRCLEKFLRSFKGDQWVDHQKPGWEKKGLLLSMANYYRARVPEDQMAEEVSEVVELAAQDEAHFKKVMASALPTLAQLTTEPLDELISPKLNTGLDKSARQYLNIEQLIETGGVLYLALDSLGDATVASTVAKLAMAATCGAASKRYTYQKGEGCRVSVFVDEAHGAISDPMINMMAVARGAKFEMYISSQTLPDYIDKTSEAQAQRIVGLASNLFCLRVNDGVTQDYVAKSFGETRIKSVQVMLSGGSATASGVDDFAGGYGERMSTEKEMVFPANLLGSLPTLQFVARIADGNKIKGRIPILR